MKTTNTAVEERRGGRHRGRLPQQPVHEHIPISILIHEQVTDSWGTNGSATRDQRKQAGKPKGQDKHQSNNHSNKTTKQQTNKTTTLVDGERKKIQLLLFLQL